MAATVLGDAVKLLQDFGFFDVILPFLLVFTVVFGILEKTKIFGTEGEKGHPKKNIDAMVAFVIAIFFQSFGWLEPIYEYISGRGHDVFIVVIFIGIIAAVVGFVFNTGTEAKS